MTAQKSGKRPLLSEAQKRQYLAYLKAFSSAKILVIGDFILDQFIWGKVDRISPEAPVPVVHVQKESFMLGGSLNVAHNIHSLGGMVFPCGVLGRDRDGRMLRKVIAQEKIETGGIIYEKDRPTTLKTRIIAHSQQVVRFDREKIGEVSEEAMRNLLRFVRHKLPSVDVVIAEDYGKGVINQKTLQEVIRLARRLRKPVLVDPKEKHFPFYRGATLMTPNRKEAFGGADLMGVRHGHDLDKAGPALVKKLNCHSVLITLGEDGMALYEKNGRKTHIPTAAREVFDVSGAGDTVIAAMGLALGAGASMKDAAMMSNLAAGIVVGKLGTATVSPEELKEAILNA